jgi:hypothetical protein
MYRSDRYLMHFQVHNKKDIRSKTKSVKSSSLSSPLANSPFGAIAFLKRLYKIASGFHFFDRLCGLVVRVSGCRCRGPGFDSPALPDFLRSSGSGTGSTQPREYS